MRDFMLGGADVIIAGARCAGMAVWVEDGRIAAVGPDRPGAAGRTALPPDALLAPGFIDTQVNGGGGVLFNDTPTAEAALAIAAAHRRLGTTAILPTLITDTPAAMQRAAAAARDAVGTRNGGVIGIHFEGPFLSQARPGVHLPGLIRAPEEADLALLEALATELPGPIVLTVAPETVPDDSLARLAAAGIILSAGHSMASLDRVQASMGLRGITHVFNAMPPAAARDPGLVAAALTLDRLFCGVIADGIHVHPAMLTLLLRCKPPGRILLVSDAMAVAGTDRTGFVLQGRPVFRRDGRLVTEDGTLAGADLCMAQAVRFMAGLPGVSLEQALGMASSTPAAFLGISADRGEIAVGRRADFVLLDAEAKVLGTWVGGDEQAAA